MSTSNKLFIGADPFKSLHGTFNYVPMTEFEHDVADDVWNSLSYDEMSQWNDVSFRKKLYKKYWKERLDG